MKKFSFILFLGIILGCTKQEFKKNEIRDNVTLGDFVAPSIKGKWKLLAWTTYYFDMTNCQSIGGQFYNAIDVNEQVEIEFLSNSVINIYEDGMKTNTGLITLKEQNNYFTTSYFLNGSEMKIFVYRLDENDYIDSCQIGDTVIIMNPYVNLNENSGNIKGLAWNQAYVKIQ